MATRKDWSKYPLDHKSERERRDILAFRMLLDKLVEEHGGQSAAARWLGYPKSSSIIHIATGRSNLGTAMIARLHERGIDILTLFPDHGFTKALASSSGSSIHQEILVIPLESKNLNEFLANGKTNGSRLVPLPASVSSPAKGFAVEVSDDSLVEFGISRGMVVLIDPSGNLGTGDTLLVSDYADQTLKLVASEKLPESCVVLGSGYYATCEGFSI